MTGMVPSQPPGRTLLLGVVTGNIAATILHYTDNILRFASYPEPSWLSPARIGAVWLIVTAIAVAGYLLFTRGRRVAGAILLGLYAASGLLALGHYRYGSPWDLPLAINLTILLEAAAALALIGTVALIQSGVIPSKGGRAGGTRDLTSLR